MGEKTANPDLIAVLLPQGPPQLEWAAAGARLSKSRLLLQEELYARFAQGGQGWLLGLGFADADVPLSPSLNFWRNVAGRFTRQLIRTPDLETLRGAVRIDLPPQTIDTWLARAPIMTGLDYLDGARLEAVWDRLHEVWQTAIQAYDGTVAAFVRTYRPNAHLVGRIFFHLVENKDADLPFAFLATYSTRLNQEGQSRHVPLKFALQEFAGDREKLLALMATVYDAARSSRLIGDMLDSGSIFQPLAWSADQAFHFLQDIPIFEDAGVLCRIPNWWKAGAPRITLDLQFGGQQSAFVGMEAILSFTPRLHLDGEPLSKKEIEQLLAQSEGLALIKNKWVAVDPDKLEQTLVAYQRAEELTAQGGLSWLEAMRLQLNPGTLFGDADQTDGLVSVSHDVWLAELMQKLRDPATLNDIRPGKTFKARLRGYQRVGVNWLGLLRQLRLGACLADDMGLGKTIQVLALLNVIYAQRRAKKDRRPPSLLVVPAPLLANWMAEIQRFYPALSVFFAHPGMQSKADLQKGGSDLFAGCDLVVTTYALAGRYDFLKAQQWYYLILDEAQAIKNPGTKQTRTLKAYQAQHRLILTGTPIENRLSDLWSLFDFLNPGLLGTAAEFKRFTKSLSQDPSRYGLLRQLIRPYVLRRLKTDKTVIRDLPDKIEMKTFTDLSRRQIVLYKQMVDGLEKALAEKDGMQRQGLILSSLMKLKQLCNHPDQYLGEGGYKEAESGKFTRLREICETVLEKRERVLVFTQFREIIDPLCTFLADVFQRPGLFIHGSVPVKARKHAIDQFQADAYVPFMVLSLKAGGVGLNLTRASHVVHFDRWWNPAVENQATDRAFRIGQRQNVVVHKFVTRGTVEERIDRMIEEKKKLSDDVIASGQETWITEMDDREVMELFRLSLE